jgi:hypothetical protein
MADYRDLAIALGGGYGQDTGPITPDTLITLKGGKKATASDLLGMIKEIGAGSLSNLESLVRGGVAQVPGAGGDLEGLARMGINKAFGAGGVNVNPTPVLPTTTDILGMMPRATTPRQETAGMQELGGYMAPAARMVGKGAMETGRFVAPKAGQLAEQYMVKTGGILPLDVYHGTPHTFPPTPRNPLGEFDASKIGTGEGAQAYGHGLYVAENPSVAKDYTFVNQNWFDTGKATYKGKSIDHWYNQAQKDQDIAFRTKNKALEKSAAARLAYWEDVMTHTHPEKVLKNMTDPNFGWDEAANYAKSIDLTKFKGVPDSGAFYKVDLPDEKIAMMLDWDKPLNQQSPTIKALAKQYGLNDADHLGGDLVAAMDAKRPAGAQKMREAGITGIRYFDAGSRDANKGTRNFVVFPGEEKSMTILERNAKKP